MQILLAQNGIREKQRRQESEIPWCNVGGEADKRLAHFNNRKSGRVEAAIEVIKFCRSKEDLCNVQFV